MCLSIPSKIKSIDTEMNTCVVDTMGVERSPTIIANNIIRALEKKEIFSKNILSISNEFSPNNILNIILNHFKDVIK
jgi:hypothetical protein